MDSLSSVLAQGVFQEAGGEDALQDFVTSFGELDDALFSTLVQDFLRSPGHSLNFNFPTAQPDDEGEVCQSPQQDNLVSAGPTPECLGLGGSTSTQLSIEAHCWSPEPLRALSHDSTILSSEQPRAACSGGTVPHGPCLSAPEVLGSTPLPCLPDASACSSQLGPFQQEPLLQQPWQMPVPGNIGPISLSSPHLYSHQYPVIPQQAQPLPPHELSSTSAGNTDVQKNSDEQKKRSRRRQRKRQPDPRHILAQKEAELQRLHQENQILRQRNEVLERVINCRNEQLARLQKAASFKPPSEEEMAELVQRFSLDTPRGTLEFDARLVHFFKHKSAAQLAQGYKRRLQALSNALVNAATDPAAMEDVLLLMQSVYSIMQVIFLVNPHCMKVLALPIDGSAGEIDKIASMGAAAMSMVHRATPAHWEGVVRACALSPQQAQECLLLHQLFSAWSQRVLADRTHLAHQLTAALAGSTEYYHGTACKEYRMGEMKEGLLLDVLHRNLVKERCIYSLLKEVIYTTILTPLQGAQLAVQAYPYVPDAVAILDAIARVHGQGHQLPQLPTQLQAATQSPAVAAPLPPPAGPAC